MRKLIDFESLKPEYVLSKIIPGFSFAKVLEGVAIDDMGKDEEDDDKKDKEKEDKDDKEKAEADTNDTAKAEKEYLEASEKYEAVQQLPKNLETTGVSSGNLIENMQQYFIVIVGLAIFLIFLCVVAVMCKTMRDTTRRFFVSIVQKLIWNGIIRSISIAYMNIVISLVVQLVLLEKLEGYGTKENLLQIGGLLTFSLGYGLVSLAVMIYNRDRLDLPETRAKYGNLYKNIDLHRQKWTILYYPFFILRRFLFLMIPVLLMGHPAQ